MFPVYLKFKGGKGVSTAAGVALALAPIPLVVALAVWVIVFFAGRYVSLASIVASATLMFFAPLCRLTGWGSDNARSWWTIGFFVIISLLAIIRHKANIVRLCNGTENRFERKRAQGEATK